jgi:hypothetical protein
VILIYCGEGPKDQYRGLLLSITNIASGSRYLRKHSKMLARVIIVFSVYVFLSSSSISVLSAYGQLYFPSNTIQPSLSSSNLVSPFLSISRQSISPWFPSLPAISCGAGIFSFTIEGVPDKGVKVPINDEKLMALQVELDKDNRGLFFTSSNDVSGKIFVGKNNIETNQGDDFDVKNLFNNCRTLAFSSTGDVKIKTPLPATPASDRVDTVILPTPQPFAPQVNPLTSNSFSNNYCPTGYYRNSLGYCVPLLQ